MTEKPTVVEALAAVMTEIDAVGKGGHNSQQNYNFRGVDAVVNAVGPALRKHGVLMVPHAGIPVEEKYNARGGTAMTRVVLPVTFTFHGPAGDVIDCHVYGESSDSGDKVMPKAHSVAWRVAMLQVFAIPTDDPDPDASSHERAPEERAAPISEELAALVKRYDALPTDARKALDERIAAANDGTHEHPSRLAEGWWEWLDERLTEAETPADD